MKNDPEYKNTRNYKKSLGPNHCEVCGWDKFVTKHRIKPGRRGGKYVLGNVIVLCPNCHALAELGEYSQYELFLIVQDRIRRDYNERVTTFAENPNTKECNDQESRTEQEDIAS